MDHLARMRLSVSVVVLLCLACFANANNITAYQSKVNSIFQAAVVDTIGYQRLGELCDTFGSRLSGSDSLESAIDWIVSQMQNDGFDEVTTEAVTVTKVSAHITQTFKCFVSHILNSYLLFSGSEDLNHYK
jgi:hypothetical protein